MAYKVDKPEVNSDEKRLEKWADIATDDLVFALNDLDRRIREAEKKVESNYTRIIINEGGSSGGEAQSLSDTYSLVPIPPMTIGGYTDTVVIEEE